MGILYLDESGNTGLWDKDQTKLIYGGPYVNASSWSKLNDDIASIQAKYKALILSRFTSGLRPNIPLTELETGITFLVQFNLHAKEIINRNGLWSKLNRTESFQVLEDVLDSMIKNNVYFYFGILDKINFRPANKLKRNDMREYKTLLPQFLQYVENKIGEQEEIMVFVDDGDITEQTILRQSVCDSTLSKCLGELVVGKYSHYPLLQMADVGVWIIQAYERLDASRTDAYAKSIQSLYEKLSSSLKEFRI